MQEDLLIAKVQGEAIKELAESLQKSIDGPGDPRIEEAKALERLALLAERFKGFETAKVHRQRAKYLRACFRRGIDA